MEKYLAELSNKVSKELERCCLKLNLDNYQHDILDEAITSVFTKEMSNNKDISKSEYKKVLKYLYPKTKK